MENTFTKVGELVNYVKEYINNRSASVKFTIAEKSSLLISTLLAAFVVMLFFTFSIAFANLALAAWLGELIGKKWAAYLITAVLNAVAAFVLWASRSRLIRFPVMNGLLKQFFQNDEEDQ